MSTKDKVETIRNFLRCARTKEKHANLNVFRVAARISEAARHGGSMSEGSRLSRVRKELKGYSVTPSISRKGHKHPCIKLKDENSGEEIIV